MNFNIIISSTFTIISLVILVGIQIYIRAFLDFKEQYPAIMSFEVPPPTDVPPPPFPPKKPTTVPRKIVYPTMVFWGLIAIHASCFLMALTTLIFPELNNLIFATSIYGTSTLDPFSNRTMITLFFVISLFFLIMLYQLRRFRGTIDYPWLLELPKQATLCFYSILLMNFIILFLENAITLTELPAEIQNSIAISPGMWTILASVILIVLFLFVLLDTPTFKKNVHKTK